MMPFLRSHLDAGYLGQASENGTAAEAAEDANNLPPDASGAQVPAVVVEQPLLMGLTRQQLILIGAVALATYWLLSRGKGKGKGKGR